MNSKRAYLAHFGVGEEDLKDGFVAAALEERRGLCRPVF